MQYKIDSTKVSLREYSLFGSLFTGLIGKIFRVPIPFSTNEPPVDSFDGCLIAAEAVPAEVMAELECLKPELEQAGFHSPIFLYLYHTLTNTDYYWADYLHSSGETVARITRRFWRTPVPPRCDLYCNLISAFADGKWLVTTSSKPGFELPPEVKELRIKQGSVAQLWSAHSGELGRLKAGQAVVYQVTAPEHLLWITQSLHSVLRDLNVKRGIFAVPSKTEEEQLEAVRAAQDQAQQSGSAHPEVLAQIELLQRKQTGWGNAILLLVVSMIFFVAAGGARWDWKYVLAIIPVLLFHELGHYLAMRAFNYKNLRMFFIPLLGAAVSGSNYNVPGWKKVIVSLAGPVPGILLGIALTVVGLFFGIDWVKQLALLLVVLNGFNLLPILPLDGGWVMHTLFFSRSFILDVIFRVVAVAGLAGLGIATGDRILMFICIPLGLSLPIAIKLARISSKLKAERLPEVSADNQTIPFITAERIITEIKKAVPKGLTTKLTAQHTLSVFETLNARPPGWLATIFYSIVHAGSFAAAFLCLGFILLAQRGDLAFGNLQGFRPVSCEAGLGEVYQPESTEKFQTFLVTFPKEQEASEHLERLQGESAANLGLRKFGRTVLATYPEREGKVRERLLELTENRSTNYIVQTEQYFPSISLVGNAPEETTAEAIVQKVNQSLTGGARYRLVPIWSPAASGPEWSVFQRARETFRTFATSDNVYTNQEIRSFDKKIQQAQRTGDSERVKALEAEQLEIEKRLLSERRKQLADSKDHEQEFLALLEKESEIPILERTNETYLAIERQISQKLGSSRREDGTPVRQQDVFTAVSGYAYRHGKKVIVSLSYRDGFHGPPATVQWLCSLGCTGLLYSFEGMEDMQNDALSE